MLARMDSGQGERPLDVVGELCISGSYVRGAADPRDIDLIVDLDSEHASHMAASLRQGRNLDIDLRHLLIGYNRSFDIRFHGSAEPEGELQTIWRRGDSLDDALARLDSISAGDADEQTSPERTLPVFDGIGHWVPRWTQEATFDAVSAGAIQIERIELSGRSVRNPGVAKELERRWRQGTSLLKAAVATVAYWEAEGIDLRYCHLHGRDLHDHDAAYFASFSFRFWRAAPHCLSTYRGREWLEIVRPRQKLPLVALRVTSLDTVKLEKTAWE